MLRKKRQPKVEIVINHRSQERKNKELPGTTSIPQFTMKEMVLQWAKR